MPLGYDIEIIRTQLEALTDAQLRKLREEWADNHIMCREIDLEFECRALFSKDKEPWLD